MVWTKLNFYITTVFLIILVFTSLGIVGTSLINSDRHDLNNKSVDYVLQIKGDSSDAGYQSIADKESSTSQEGNILDSEDDNQVSDNNDFLSTLFIKKERASEPTNLLKVIYNAPTSLLIGLGLPIIDFKHIINILAYFLFISLILVIWIKVVRQ